MKRAVVLLTTLLFAACDSPTEPAELANSYHIVQINGESLPARNVDSFSNAAGSCELDLIRGHVSFSGRFFLSLSYEMRCTGNPNPIPSLAELEGTYTRTRDQLIVSVPTAPGKDVVEEAQIDGEYLDMTIRRANGTRLVLRFWSQRGY